MKLFQKLLTIRSWYEKHLVEKGCSYRLLALLADFKEDLIVDWLSDTLINMNSTMRALSVSLVQSMKSCDWPQTNTKNILLALLKSLTEKLKPNEGLSPTVLEIFMKKSCLYNYFQRLSQGYCNSKQPSVTFC